ncbi:MAG: molybdopterin-binding/glycosyltransferase family 2 protein [Rhodospirillales bacterium]|jgi:molybdenum cofactor cytidylyltransferase|nr:4-diphosphocytidyl-2C-methyl-D-erythritol kinase [Rhodospirillaceae bacterium]MDP6429649.1 molybdopterin-binding/glycosyltransferase family 2 protein [Rhodospirillales bacterium]MDP6644142.1 molybdopterin-binding/glycosyltransferase family 2 protein [Rhodospirillales bacterium]
MKFGPIPTAEASGAILAHSTRLPGRVIKKGRVLSGDDIAAIAEAGIEEITAARLEPGDVTENEAAAAITEALAGSGVRMGRAFTGRCNLIADAHGVLILERQDLDRLNLVSESVTVATLAPFDVVSEGQLVATIKIIPFAIASAILDEAVAAAGPGAGADRPMISVAPFTPRQTGLILTRLPGMKESILDNTAKTASQRIEALGSRISQVIRCDHQEGAVAEAIKAVIDGGCEMVFIFGASAVVDRQDVLPAAVEAAGGRVDHFGMPVDPGNLLFIGSASDRPVVGMPGCARSPKLNGFDWVLWRLLAGIEVTPRDIMAMGSGGLLKEISERGQLRQAQEDGGKAAAREPRIGALILAAGSSRRMGAENKLLADVGGKPMVSHVAGALAGANVVSITVVTGHQAEAVKSALGELAADYVHNPDYAEGLSTSLRAGVASLADDIDGVVICLGDMPLVSSSDIDNLIAAFDPLEGRGICVPVSGRKRGNPVLWAKSYLTEIAGLGGDVGARHLLEQHADQVYEVPVSGDGVLTDIDTPERLAELRSRK